MKTTPGMLLACGLLLATALPVVAQDEELPPPPPLTSIPDAQFCALITDDLVTCEGVLTELGESNILPASFAPGRGRGPRGRRRRGRHRGGDR